MDGPVPSEELQEGLLHLVVRAQPVDVVVGDQVLHPVEAVLVRKGDDEAEGRPFDAHVEIVAFPNHDPPLQRNRRSRGHGSAGTHHVVQVGLDVEGGVALLLKDDPPAQVADRFGKIARLGVVVQYFDFDDVDTIVGRLQDALELRRGWSKVVKGVRSRESIRMLWKWRVRNVGGLETYWN